MVSNQLITLDEVIATAATVIVDADYSARNIWKNWAYWAERDIGYSKALEKVTTTPLTVTNLLITKPSDYIEAIDIALFKSDGTEIPAVYRPGTARIHLDVERNNRVANVNTIDVSEDRSYFILGSEGDDITEAILRYWGLPLDGNGLPLIPDSHVYAIIAFIDYMWAMRQDKSRLVVADKRQEWKIQMRRTRNEDSMPSMLEGEQIAKTFNSMIQNLKIDRF